MASSGSANRARSRSARAATAPRGSTDSAFSRADRARAATASHGSADRARAATASQSSDDAAFNVVEGTVGSSSVPVFTPWDFYEQRLANKAAELFWKGGLVLVTKAQVEDDAFWEANQISLAVSFNGGCFQDPASPGEGWFQYPPGRKALNIPVTVPALFAARTRSCLPHIVGVLAAGRNVALHCLNTVHRGPLGLTMLVMAFAPPAAAPDVLQVTGSIRTKWPRASNALTMATAPPKSKAGGRDWKLRCRRNTVAVEARGLAANLMRDAEGDELRIWQSVLEVKACKPGKRQLEKLDALLAKSQVGVKHGLPEAELEAAHTEWRSRFGGRPAAASATHSSSAPPLAVRPKLKPQQLRAEPLQPQPPQEPACQRAAATTAVAAAAAAETAVAATAQGTTAAADCSRGGPGSTQSPSSRPCRRWLEQSGRMWLEELSSPWLEQQCPPRLGRDPARLEQSCSIAEQADQTCGRHRQGSVCRVGGRSSRRRAGFIVGGRSCSRAGTRPRGV